MTKIRQLAVASAIMLCAPGVYAQTSTETVFDELVAFYSAMGMSVEAGDRTLDGDTFTASDVVFTYSSLGAETTLTIDSVEVIPSEEPDYAFELRFSDDADAVVTTEIVEGQEPLVTEMRIEQPGNVTLIGGTPEERTFAYSADAVRFVFDEAPMGGQDDVAFDMVLALNTVAGTASDDGDDSLTYQATAADMTVDYTISADGEGFVFSTVYKDVAFSGDGPIGGMVDIAALTASDETSRGVFTMQSSESRIQVDDFGGSTVVEATSGPGKLEATVGAGHLDYSFESAENNINVVSASMPVPSAEFNADKMAFRFAVPVAPTSEPGEMIVDLELAGVSISEEIWGMFDPTGGIPRTDATIVLRARSTATALVDLTDTETMQNNPQAMMNPFDFDDVTIEELLISVAGVELEATGAAQLMDAGPIPMPVGGIDLKLAGALGLLETLQEIGLVPPEQAQAAPMMLGMFALPGDAPDTFTSRIEMTEDGQLTANGVPLQ